MRNPRIAVVMLVASVAGLTGAAAGQEVIRLDFEKTGKQALRTYRGDWQQAEGVLKQMSDGGEAVALANMPAWSTYRATVKGRAMGPLSKGQSVGLIAEAANENNYYLFRMIQKKGGLYGELLRQDPQRVTTVENYLVGDQAPLAGDPTQWHELRLDVDGVHLCAYMDGKPVLMYSFSGKPSATYPHPALWPHDLIAGVAGVYALGARAAFDDLRVVRLDSGDEVVAPLKPRRADGRLLPRRPYGEVVRKVSEWTMRASEVVEPPADLPALARGWDPVTLCSFVYINDSQRGVTDIQYPGHNHPMTIIGLVDYYLYSGDRRAMAKAGELADWNLKYCVPSGWAVAGLPLSHFDYHKLKADGSYDPPESNFEPDKAAYSGQGLLRVYAVTGDDKYLKAARHIGDTLLKLQLPGGNFPFRINPRTGQVVAEYTCSLCWYVQFFDLLVELTGENRYQAARDRAFHWLLANPVRSNNWQGFYGDVGSGTVSYDQWTALDTAMYLIDHRADDPTFLDKARAITAWCTKTLVRYDGFHPGVPSLIEQTCYPAILTHHVVRLADTYARFYGATGSEADRRQAQEIANSVSRLQLSDGKFPWGLWHHAQANAYALSFASVYIRLMSEMPETAPADECHLLWFSRQVRQVEYGLQRVAYRTWGPGRERLKLSGKPQAVNGAGKQVVSKDELNKSDPAWHWDERNQVLDVRHSGRQVEIVLK